MSRQKLYKKGKKEQKRKFIVSIVFVLVLLMISLIIYKSSIVNLSKIIIVNIIIITVFVIINKHNIFTLKGIKIFQFAKKIMLGFFYVILIVLSTIFIANITNKVFSNDYYVSINDLPQSFVEKGYTKNIILENLSNRIKAIKSSDSDISDFGGPESDNTVKLEVLGNAIYIDQSVLWLRNTLGIKKNIKITLGHNKNKNIFYYGHVENDDKTFGLERTKIIARDSIQFSVSMDSLLDAATFESFAILDPSKLSHYYKKDLEKLKQIGNYIYKKKYDFPDIKKLKFLRIIGNRYFDNNQYNRADYCYNEIFKLLNMEKIEKDHQYYKFIDSYSLNKLNLGEAEDLIKFLKLEEKNLVTKSNLGLSNALIGNHKVAIKHYESVLNELDKGKVDLKFYEYELTGEPFIVLHLLHLYLTDNDLTKAKELFEKTLLNLKLHKKLKEKHWIALVQLMNTIIILDKDPELFKKLESLVINIPELSKIMTWGNSENFDMVKPYGFASKIFFINEFILNEKYAKSTLAYLQIRNNYTQYEYISQHKKVLCTTLPYHNYLIINEYSNYELGFHEETYKEFLQEIIKTDIYDNNSLYYLYYVNLNFFNQIHKNNIIEKEMDSIRAILDIPYLKKKFIFSDIVIDNPNFDFDTNSSKQKIIIKFKDYLSKNPNTPHLEDLKLIIELGDIWQNFQDKLDSNLVLIDNYESEKLLNSIVKKLYSYKKAWIYKQAIHITRNAKVSSEYESILLDIYMDDTLQITSDLNRALLKLGQPQLAMDVIIKCYKNDKNKYASGELEKNIHYSGTILYEDYIDSLIILSLTNTSSLYDHYNKYFSKLFLHEIQSSNILKNQEIIYNNKKIIKLKYLLKANSIFNNKDNPYPEIPLYKGRSKIIDLTTALLIANKYGLEINEIDLKIREFISKIPSLNKMFLDRNINLKDYLGVNPNKTPIIDNSSRYKEKFIQLSY